MSCPIHAQTVVSRVIQVPLHWTTISGGGEKLGIYASLGGGTTPQLFEFDTGGAGFYAAYAPNRPSTSSWWGRSFTPTGQSIQVLYDSGLFYQGSVVTTAVSLYASRHDRRALVTTARNARVGQMTSITNTNGGPALWTPSGGKHGPPIDGAFYGDFGASLMYDNNNIVNLLAQLRFATGWCLGSGCTPAAVGLTSRLAWSKRMFGAPRQFICR